MVYQSPAQTYFYQKDMFAKNFLDPMILPPP